MFTVKLILRNMNAPLNGVAVNLFLMSLSHQKVKMPDQTRIHCCFVNGVPRTCKFQ